MSHDLQDPAQLFTVFGTPFVSERHVEGYRKDVAAAARQTNPLMFEEALGGFFTVMLESLYASHARETERTVQALNRPARTH